ncbi:MAG: hypothetical protein WBQ32_08750 [Ignavibacteriaceae bacterium]
MITHQDFTNLKKTKMKKEKESLVSEDRAKYKGKREVRLFGLF